MEFAGKVVANDVEQPHDGGQVRIELTPVQHGKLRAAAIVLSYAADEPMRDWPSTRATMEAKRYRVVIEEIPAEGPGT